MTTVSAALGASAPIARLGPRVTVYPVEPVAPVRAADPAPVEETVPVPFTPRDEASAARSYIEALETAPPTTPAADAAEADEAPTLAEDAASVEAPGVDPDEDTAVQLAFEAAAGYAEAAGQIRRTSSGTLLDTAA